VDGDPGDLVGVGRGERAQQQPAGAVGDLQVAGDPGQGDGGQPEEDPEGGRLAEGDRALPGAADHQPGGQVAKADQDERAADQEGEPLGRSGLPPLAQHRGTHPARQGRGD
jgi:hypothetical protein